MYALPLLFSITILVFICLFTYYNYISFTYLSKFSIHTYIPLCSITLYSILLFKYYHTISLNILLEYFFLEWIFVCPLLLYGLSSIKVVNNWAHMLLTTLCICMNMLGYASTTILTVNGDMLIPFILFGSGTILYCTLSGVIIWIYIQTPNVIENSRQYAILNINKMYKVVSIILFFSWNLYPIVYFLFITGSISIIYCIVGFTLLDYTSKGVFSFLLLGYELHKERVHSLPTQFAQRIARIHPIESYSHAAEAGTADWTLSQIPNENGSIATIEDSA